MPTLRDQGHRGARQLTQEYGALQNGLRIPCHIPERQEHAPPDRELQPTSPSPSKLHTLCSIFPAFCPHSLTAPNLIARSGWTEYCSGGKGGISTQGFRESAGSSFANDGRFSSSLGMPVIRCTRVTMGLAKGMVEASIVMFLCLALSSAAALVIYPLPVLTVRR